MNRKTWDQLISSAGVVLAVALIVLGGLAVYGGNFAQSNVTDRLEPQNITFPPFEEMTPEEQADIGDFAGQQVTDGAQAEAFSRYIQGHLGEINEGATYSETSSAAREEGLDPDTAAELQGKADTLFKGETLRAILLNAYGWWTAATIAVYAGYLMIVVGILLGILAFLGFRHARRGADEVEADARTAVAV
ncbi:MAG: hypothetical protein ACXWZF_07925 [Actinomycetota bacterium]